MGTIRQSKYWTSIKEHFPFLCLAWAAECKSKPQQRPFAIILWLSPTLKTSTANKPWLDEAETSNIKMKKATLVLVRYNSHTMHQQASGLLV